MSTTTLISQRDATGLSATVTSAPVATLLAATVTVAFPTVVAPAPHSTPTNAMYMTWLGGGDENVCFSGTSVSKRITTGHLDRCLT